MNKKSKKMATVAFHSFKGGVGRTTAAINFARGAAVAGNKVLLLEMDVDAPGIMLKPPIISNKKYYLGYVDYLSHFYDNSSLPDNIHDMPMPKDSRATLDRIDYLQKIAIDVELPKQAQGELKVLAAGLADDRYWWNLNSDWFNNFFSVARGEYSKAGKFHLHTNRSLFREEKRLLSCIFSEKDTKNARKNLLIDREKDVLEDINAECDILVIDCKSAREYACVPLYYWCDAAVLMLPYNLEGLYNLARMYRAVKAASLSVRGDPDSVKVYPVVCRVPANHFKPSDAKDDLIAVNTVLSRLKENENYQGDPQFLDSEESKFRNLEAFSIQEAAEATTDETYLVDLQHDKYPEIIEDQAKLFNKICDDNNIDLKSFNSSGKDNLNWVKMLVPEHAQENKRVDETLEKDKDGIFFNKDGQPNVLLRRVSMRLIMSNLSSAITDLSEQFTTLGASSAVRQTNGNTVQRSDLEAALDSFTRAGRSVGESYVGTSIPAEERARVQADPEAFLRLVRESCYYDSVNAGFGHMRVQSDEPGKVSRIIWEKCFFVEESTSTSKGSNPKRGILATSLCFLEGYLSGSLNVMHSNFFGEDSDGRTMQVRYLGQKYSPKAHIGTVLKKPKKLQENKLIFEVKY